MWKLRENCLELLVHLRIYFLVQVECNKEAYTITYKLCLYHTNGSKRELATLGRLQKGIGELVRIGVLINGLGNCTRIKGI